MRQLTTLTTITAITLFTYGCGGSSNNDDSTKFSPNGIYSGAITGGFGVFPSGPHGDEKAIIYNNKLIVFSTILDIQSIITSDLNINDKQFTGTINVYTNDTPIVGTADITGSFDDQNNFSATFTNGTNVNFDDGNINLTSVETVYNRGSDVSTVAGSWQGQYGGFSETTTIAINTSGEITSGSDTSGCSFTGTITPADTTVNVYNVSISSTGGTGCTTLPAANYSGFAWTEGDNDTILNFSVSNSTHGRTVILTKN